MFNTGPYGEQVRTSKELGRYLAAKRDISAGEVLYEEAPTVVGPKLVEPSPVCLGCLRAPGTASCVGCGWPACSATCPGLRDPHCHAIECKILSLAPVSHSQQCRYRIKSINSVLGPVHWDRVTPVRTRFCSSCIECALRRHPDTLNYMSGHKYKKC